MTDAATLAQIMHNPPPIIPQTYNSFLCGVQKLDTSPYRRKAQWDRQDFVNLCIHTFTAESDSMMTDLCDAASSDEQTWNVSVSMMAYIMCCLDLFDLQVELAK